MSTCSLVDLFFDSRPAVAGRQALLFNTMSGRLLGDDGSPPALRSVYECGVF
jgi:hypothetical protein